MPDFGFILDFFNYIIDFLETGIYDLFVQLFAYVIKSFLISYLDFKIWLLTFSWDISKSIVQSYQLSQSLQTAFDNLPYINLLSAIQVPECINLIATGYITRFVFRVVW